MNSQKKGRDTTPDTNEEANGKIQEPFELVSCPRGGKNCNGSRAVINESVIASRKYLLNKEYNESINELKNAFQQTNNLQEPVCQQCVQLFQTTIIQSVEQIHKDLHRMTTGIFRAKRYRPSLEYADKVLEELKNKKGSEST